MPVTLTIASTASSQPPTIEPPEPAPQPEVPGAPAPPSPAPHETPFPEPKQYPIHPDIPVQPIHENDPTRCM